MDRRIAVSEFLTATCARTIARPELSLTLPEIVPPATCARQALAITSTIAVTYASVKGLESEAVRIGLRSIRPPLHCHFLMQPDRCRVDRQTSVLPTVHQYSPPNDSAWSFRESGQSMVSDPVARQRRFERGAFFRNRLDQG